MSPVGGSFIHMLRRLDPSIPRDIRAAVEGALHGWQRPHRFHIAMAFPSLDTAAVYIGTHQSALVTQFQRLERDIGAALYQRGAHRKPHRPTRRGQTLISDLQRDHVRALMHAELPPKHTQPYPDRVTLAAAQQHADRARQPPRPTPITGIAVQRLRRTRTLLALLRDNPDEFYGLQVHQRTGINEGTLYPLLHRLHSAGWLTSRPEDDQSWLAGAPPGRGPGRRRTYYTLTTEGHRAAHHELNQPRRKRKTDETTHAQNP